MSGIACATTEPPVVSPAVPHIALMLPLNSPTLGAAAEAVRQGFMAAASLQKSGLPVIVYSDYDEAHGVIETYNKAISGGAVAVAGPLTRRGIHLLAEGNSIPVPTLALNIIEDQAPPLLYFFGMAVEAEARQVAALAWQQGFKQAIVISSNAPLSRRLQFAFEEQWNATGGTILREIEFSGDTTALSDIAATPESMVFFATEIGKARTIRPYLPTNLPAYATSLLFAGNRDTLVNFDLEGIRFIDMPWLMQGELASVMSYPRANPPLSTENERLYALGIDAHRLIYLLLDNQINAALPLDGVTGKIRLDGQTFVREAVPAIFVRGHGQSTDAPVAPAEQMFPAQFRNASQVEAAATSDLTKKP
ncbi:MAG: penicillin-binding protein activator [Gallionella sp.]|nr:penicillin-binding protein activator [Gallionella sp.]